MAFNGHGSLLFIKMILYEYICDEDGPFELFRPISQASEPAPCPVCGKLCPRSYTVPRISQIDPGKMSAIEKNLKSQFEPSRYSVHGDPRSHGVPSSHRPKMKRKAYGGPRSWVMESTA
jgi:putative FmdB family regulatory protein